MFDLNEFISSCQAALKEHAPQLAAKELMEGADESLPGPRVVQRGL